MASRIAFVSGGSSGIGQACAFELARRGFTVIIGDIDDVNGKKTVDSITQEGNSADFVHLDVSVYDEWVKVAEDVKRKHGSLHFLLNNAGWTTRSVPILEADVDEYDKVMRINANSVFYGCKAFGKQLLEQKEKASVVNVSSIYGIIGGKGAKPGYCASKGAVRSITKNIALSWAKEGVRVNSIHPGFIETPLLVQQTLSEPGERERLEGQIPMSKLGSCADIAKTVAFLASDDAAYITGSEIVVDGGYTAQ